MGIDRDTLEQLRHLVRPLVNRIANTVARSVVQLVNDEKKMQLVQLGVLAGETIEGNDGGGEHFQSYGFSSVPLAGAEAIVVFPNGDREHPLVFAASDRRYRPTGGEPGQVTMHHYNGAKVTMLANGDIMVQPGAGGHVLVDDGSGAGPLVTQAQFMNHTHATAGTGTPSPPITVSPSPALTGTSVLKAK